MRSHPPTLLKMARRTILDEHLFGPGDRVLVAVSGGPDSMALLHVLAKVGPELGARVSTRVEVHPGPNLMARARAARYEALQRAARAGCGARAPMVYIATGHHAEDRAETVLIRLLRGTGPAGLAVLPARAGNLIRPLVRARRADVMAHLERHHIAFADDPTNRDPRFLRTRVRREVLPLLTELSPRIVEHLCELADASAAQTTSGTEPIPLLLEGHPLGRAQRSALARALAQRNARVRVPLAGGKIAGIDLSSRTIVLIKG